MIGGGQGAPGVLFRREVQVHDRAMLRQVQPPLAAPDLLELLLRELALLQQKVAGFFLGCALTLVHWSGTTISFFVFRGRIFVCAARFVNVSACIVASAIKRLVAILAPMGATRNASPSLKIVFLAPPSVWRSEE